MSWKAGVILVEGNVVEEIPAILRELGFRGLKKQDGEINTDDATDWHFQIIASGLVGEWTMISNSRDMFGSAGLGDMGMEEPPAKGLWSERVEKALCRLSKRGRVFAMLLNGATGYWGFTLHDGGSRKRMRYVHCEKLAIDEGTPLTVESAICNSNNESPHGQSEFINDERFILALADSLCPQWNAFETRLEVFDYETFVE